MSEFPHPDVKIWYSEPIERIRITSTPGGVALTADEARAYRDLLDEQIARAEQR